MELVGRLAGGVAHDFNNQLTAILGFIDLCLLDASPDCRMRGWLNEIAKAAEHSANITQQLLAFSRKQIIAPKELDINDTVGRMLTMLRRLIGEDIAINWRPGAALWSVKMDPVQITQIMVNLAVNARDAIAGVGTISIETANVTLDLPFCAEHLDATPGNYVRLTCWDTGCGMDPQTQAHIFEPFFTTKDVGKGTGLGLATVYGIVRQNNGCIAVHSEPGKGARFEIYLPQCVVPGGPARAAETLADPPRGDETVLLVEDEESVRRMTCELLKQLGYSVLEAANAEQALRLAAQHPGVIHLLLTDVVMPGMSGRDLAQRLVALRPAIKCLFASGFTADLPSHGVITADDINFLGKPYTRHQLARKVREVLEREAP